jgi:hypothetical protein
VKKDFLENEIFGFPLSAQVLKKFYIGRHLLDNVKEWEVDFYLCEDLHHILYSLSLFHKVRRCLETYWEWGPRFI